ncbi:MAG: hypothetical protein AB7U73_12305 [Pirellulales bacterium]
MGASLATRLVKLTALTSVLLVTVSARGDDRAADAAADEQAQHKRLQQEIAQPRLVVATDACFVHALHAPVDPAGNRFMRRPASTSVAVLWTDRATGHMKPVLATGTFAIPTRRLSYSQTRLLGAAADDERLYLAVWRSGRTFDEPPPPATESFAWTAREPSRREGAIGFALVVVWLADAAQLLDEPLPPLAEVPRETTAAGLIKRVDDGVEVAGQVFKFRGRDVVRGP